MLLRQALGAGRASRCAHPAAVLRQSRAALTSAPAGAGAEAARRCLANAAPPHPYAVYLVTDDMFDTGNLVHLVDQAIQGGTTCVQLRIKDCDTRRLIELGQPIQKCKLTQALQ